MYIVFAFSLSYSMDNISIHFPERTFPEKNAQYLSFHWLLSVPDKNSISFKISALLKSGHWYKKRRYTMVWAGHLAILRWIDYVIALRWNEQSIFILQFLTGGIQLILIDGCGSGILDYIVNSLRLLTTTFDVHIWFCKKSNVWTSI